MTAAMMLRTHFRWEYLPLICIALMLVMSAAAYTFLPDMMIVHWDFSVRTDGYARKATAVLILPIIGLGIICMQLIGRYVAHDGGLEIRFSKAVKFAMPILLIAHAGIIAVGLVSGLRG